MVPVTRSAWCPGSLGGNRLCWPCAAARAAARRGPARCSARSRGRGSSARATRAWSAIRSTSARSLSGPWSLDPGVPRRRACARRRIRDPAVLAVPRLEIDVQWRALLRGRIVARATHRRAAAATSTSRSCAAEARDPVPLRASRLAAPAGTLSARHQCDRGPRRLADLCRAGRAAPAAADAASRPGSATSATSRTRRRGIRRRCSCARWCSTPAARASTAPPISCARRARCCAARARSTRCRSRRLGPLLRDYPVRIGGGTLAARGAVESRRGAARAPTSRSVAIDGIRADYLGGARPGRARGAAPRGARRAARERAIPRLTLRMDELRVRGEFGFVNLGRDPAYRAVPRPGRRSRRAT